MKRMNRQDWFALILALVIVLPLGSWAIAKTIPKGNETSIVAPNNSGSPTYSCDHITQFSIASTVGAVVVPGVTGKKTFVCSITMSAASGTMSASIVEGTGSVCGSSTVGVLGGNTAAKGWLLTGGFPFSWGNGSDYIGWSATAGTDVCILTSAATQLTGSITWTQGDASVTSATVTVTTATTTTTT